ncbi:MAG: tetratricopeptide repeat protein, partial [Kiritimatiellae bacterium]|nr:tetratricopeptide repeat protein [Kiritimatiellia bacterium]
MGHSPRHSSFVIRHSSHSSLVTRHSSLLPLALPALFALFFSLAPLARSASLPADDQLRFADGIFLRGLHEDAIHEYVAFARDYPADPRLDQVFFRLGECYRRLTNDTAALRFYARVEKDFPASPSAPKAALRRAEIALAASRFDEAAAAAAPLVSAPPPDPDDAAAALWYLGRARRGLGDSAAATQDFSALLSAHPSSPYAAYAALELASIHAGDSSPASRKRIAAWYALAAESASTPTARAEALCQWGLWAYRLGDYRAAVDAFQQLRAEFPDSPRARASALQAAWSRAHLGQTAEALELADDAYQNALSASTAASALFLRAKLLRDLGRSADALSDFASLVRLYPDTPSVPFAAYELMATHFERGDYERALAAIPASPAPAQAPEVLWMRAESEAALGRIDLARGHYSELSSSFPDSPRAPLALLRLAQIARDDSRLADAAALFRDAATRYPSAPSAPDALRSAALAATRLGDHDQALA